MGGITCLGIDPGLASLGWGLVAREGGRLSHLGDGTLHTKPSDGGDEARAAALGRSVRAILDDARPDVVALERWVFYPEAEPHQAHALGLVIGAVLAQVPADAPLVLLRAVDLRTALGLHKGAPKEHTRNRVEALIRTRGRSQHSADALGIAIVGAGRSPTPSRRPNPGPRAAPEADVVELLLTPLERAQLAHQLGRTTGPITFTTEGLRLLVTTATATATATPGAPT